MKFFLWIPDPAGFIARILALRKLQLVSNRTHVDHFTDIKQKNPTPIRPPLPKTNSSPEITNMSDQAKESPSQTDPEASTAKSQTLSELNPFSGLLVGSKSTEECAQLEDTALARDDTSQQAPADLGAFAGLTMGSRDRNQAAKRAPPSIPERRGLTKPRSDSDLLSSSDEQPNVPKPINSPPPIKERYIDKPKGQSETSSSTASEPPVAPSRQNSTARPKPKPAMAVNMGCSLIQPSNLITTTDNKPKKVRTPPPIIPRASERPLNTESEAAKPTRKPPVIPSRKNIQESETQPKNPPEIPSRKNIPSEVL